MWVNFDLFLPEHQKFYKSKQKTNIPFKHGKVVVTLLDVYLVFEVKQRTDNG
jgi:hypothetical protein